MAVTEVRLPETATAGSVVELYEQADGTMAADIRIPGDAHQTPA